MQWVKSFLLLVLTCACVVPTQAQVGTPKYQFEDRAEVEAAARKYKLDLRESYNVIMCATRQGMIKSVLRAYESELPANPFDAPPQLASSFALAHEMLVSSVQWDWKRDRAQGITQLSQNDGVRVTLYRDQALEALPNSPEVLLSYAIWAMNQDKRQQALNLTTKAIRYAPNWAELNWWHANALQYRLISTSEKSVKQESTRYGALILRYLTKAEQLDSGFKQENLVTKASAYSYIGRYKEALDAFDAYIRYKPGYRKLIGEQGYFATRKEWGDKARQHGQL